MRELPGLIGWLLRALPREFRDRHAQEIRANLAEVARGRPLWSRWLVWARAGVDILGVALVLRLRPPGASPKDPRERDRTPGIRGRRREPLPTAAAEALVQGTRHAWRSLRRDPGLSVLATLILGLGIGASATVYSVADALLVRPLPFAEPDRLVFISNGEWGRGQALSEITTQVARLQDLEAESRLLSGVGGFFLFDGEGDHTLLGAGSPERLNRLQVTESLFPLLGVRPRVGRLFNAEEARDGGPAVALLTHAFWVRRFASDPGVVGRALTIDDEPVTVVGVLPASFDYGAIFAPGSRIDFVTPFPLSERTNRQGNTLALIGRLRPGATVAAAHREAAAIAERNTGGARNDFKPSVRPLRGHVSGDFRFATLVLVGSVALVMAIVCANVSNLLLARGAARARELATRAALGAGRARIVRQLLVESLALAGMGAALGVVVATLGTRAIAGSGVSIPLLAGTRVDTGVLAVTILVAAVTGLVAGLAPALRGSRWGLAEALRQGGRGTSLGSRLGRIRSALVVSEIALACVLLVGAGLLIKSFVRVLDAELGFQPENVIAIRVDPGDAAEVRFTSDAQEEAHFEELLLGVRGAPGVTAAGLVDVLPMAFNRQWCFDLEDDAPWGDDCAFVRLASEGYLDALGLSLVAGRDLTAADDRGARRVVLVNETLAASAWPGTDPLGKVVINWQGGWEVVGVVRGTRHLAVDQAPGPEVFFPLRQQGDFSPLHLVARGSRSLDELTASVRQAVASVDPSLPLGDVRRIEELVDRSVSARRFTVLLLAAFGGFALVLASLGIYGVISYSVTQRHREIGLRMALGASTGGLQGRIVLGTLGLAAVGSALGLGAAWALARLMASLLYEVAPTDPAIFVAVPVLLTGVAALAGYLPARRAARVDPVRTLNAEG